MINPESRFLREIPQQLIDWRRMAPHAVVQCPVSGAGRFGTPRPAPARTAAGKRPLLVLEPGDRVTHDKYGLGRVEEVSGVGESAMSLIDFGSAGRVKLMHNHAPVTSSSRAERSRFATVWSREQDQHRAGERQHGKRVHDPRHAAPAMNTPEIGQ